MVSIGSVLMGVPDILAGIFLITVQTDLIEVMIYTVPSSAAFFLGTALFIKGIYSIAFAFFGGS